MAADRDQVVLHVEPAPVGTSPATWRPATAVPELDEGGVHVSAETSRRLARDAAVVDTQEDPDGFDAERRPQDACDSGRDPPRAQRPRFAMLLSGVHGPPLRRPPHHTLGRWRPHLARQPDAPVSPPSSAGARRRIPHRARRARRNDLCRRGQPAARRSACALLQKHVRSRRRGPALDAVLGRHAVQPRLRGGSTPSIAAGRCLPASGGVSFLMAAPPARSPARSPNRVSVPASARVAPAAQ